MKSIKSTAMAPERKSSARPGGRTARVREKVLEAALVELREKGPANVSHRAIAARAGVDAATVYRRWPTRLRLIADVLIDMSNHEIAVPNTGDLADDLLAYLQQVIAVLAMPEVRGLSHAFFLASFEEDEEIDNTFKLLWQERFSRAASMFDRAITRGDISARIDTFRMTELLVSPVWFRMLISKAPVDDGFARRCVTDVMIILDPEGV